MWKLLTDPPFMPHGHCFMWYPSVLWPYIIGHALIFVAYVSIPTLLVVFILRSGREYPRRVVVSLLLTGSFILSCGVMHIMEVVLIWKPLYYLQGWLAVLTAIISLTTAVHLATQLPAILALQPYSDLLEAHKAEETANQLLKESNKELERFAYVVSHDLQEPLRTMGGHLHILQNSLPCHQCTLMPESDRQPIEVSMEELQRSLDRLWDLIEGLLSLTRINSRGATFKPLNLYTVVDDAIDSLGRKIQATGTSIQIIGDQMPNLEGDTGQLANLFSNLFDNAIKYKHLDRQPVITVMYDKALMEVRVRDNGRGLHPSQFEKIFEMFTQVNGKGGMGIGLALCKEVARRHQMTLKATGEPGIGSVFTLKLFDTLDTAKEE